MKPVLSAWPPKKRTVAFAPIALGLWLVSFIVVALATQNIFIALLVPPFLAVGGAYALVGWPEIRTKDGKPLIEPRVKPYLFFVLAPLFALILYPILGMILMMAGLPPTKWLVIITIVLAIGVAATLAYLLVGVPNVYASALRQYRSIPPERRPFLFFPLSVVLFLAIFLALGVVTTRLVGRAGPASTGLLLNIQVLVLLPVSAALAALLAWLMVGVPKVLTAPAQHIPKVTGKHRPRAFLATFALAGIPLTIILGAILTYYSPLPATIVLALALLLGYVTSLGIALLAWGTPARWRTYEDYQPAIPPRAHTPLKLGGAFFVGLAIVVGFGLADIDLFWGVLVGAIVGTLVGIVLTGTHRRVLARRGEPTLVPDLPDGMKPLILFPTWFLIAFV
ncbi:MAG TPA: hypothetical protein VM582_09780, partial [Candidatus Thermoplasmatota archaeon]|nr:hypothetical protein [Candidatus Thermoplasmatota archaeon]